MKNCSELWFLHLAMKTDVGTAFGFALENEGCTEAGINLGKRADMKLCAERITLFNKEIENGILEKMREYGVPCSGLGENVYGALGITSTTSSMRQSLRFMYSDGTRVTATAGHRWWRTLSETGGCFPLKVPGEESVIYVFKYPWDVVKARYLWHSAGLGEFPAYSFSGFPLPPAFVGTKQIIFVNTLNSTANQELVDAARKNYPSGVSVSHEINIDLKGLRSVLLMKPQLELPKDPKPVKLKVAGKTAEDELIYFSEEGYRVAEPGYAKPFVKTNFAFLPKVTYDSNYPKFRRITTADLYVNGRKERENIILPNSKSPALETLYKLAETLVPPGTLRSKGYKALRKSILFTDIAERVSFPLLPCVNQSNEIVFPSFRISKQGFIDHKELWSAMMENRENRDYAALKPEQASIKDLAALARLMLNDSRQAGVAVLGICAWLYMVVTALVSMANNIHLPRMCFEAHTMDNSLSPAVSFLSRLFSGDPAPRNNAERKIWHRIRLGHLNVGARDALMEPLPGLYWLDLDAKKDQSDILYKHTDTPGIYAVGNSDMLYAANAHGNIQCAVTAEDEMPEIDTEPIRRAVLYILAKYVKNVEKINPSKWIIEKPELYMYNSVAHALRDVGVEMPGTERFDGLYLNKGR